jgi:WD40 repeat protein/beta-lactamase regulating signal transducer with metallopeptidase domain
MNPLESLRDILAQFSMVPIWAQLLTKATLLLAVAWVVHFSLARANPRWRTLLWRGVAVGLVLVALWMPCLPGLEIRIATPESVATALAPAVSRMVGERESEIPAAAAVNRRRGPASVEMMTTIQHTEAEVRPEATQPLESSEPSFSWRMAVPGIWGLGVALLAVRLAIALVKVAKLLGSCQVASEVIVAEVGRIAATLGCRRAIRTRTSREYAVPFQYGLWRPILVLPERMCRSEFRGQLPGVIAHELAHVISGDFAWNAAVQVVSTIFWFHPLTWRMASSHRASCDAACDAVATSYLGDVQAYCRTLAQVALDGAGSFPVVGVAMARTCDVRRRIAALQRRVFATALSRRAVVGVMLAGSLSSVLLAGTRFALAEPSVHVANAASAHPPRVDLYGDPLPAGAIARLGAIRYRVDSLDILGTIAFTADSKTLVAKIDNYYAGDSFCWWDATNGKRLRKVRLEDGLYSRECAITPDGRIAVTNLDSSRKPNEYGHASPEGSRLKWWDVATGKNLASVAIPYSVDSKDPVLAIAAHGDTAASDDHGVVRIWDRTTKKQTAVYEAQGSTESLSLSPNGRLVAFITQKQGVLLWDLASGQKPRAVLAPSKGFYPWKAAFSTDGKALAIAGYNGNVDLLDALTGKLIRTLDWPHRIPDMVAFSTDDKQLALTNSGDFRRDVAVWDLTSGKLHHAFERLSALAGNRLAFSPDGRLLAVAANTLQVWDLSEGKCLSAAFVGHELNVHCVVFLGSSDTVATAGIDGTVRLWDARTGRQKLLIRHESFVEALAASADGKLIASYAAGEKGTVRICDAATGNQLHEFSGRVGNLRHLGFSGDGKRLAGTGEDGKVRLWSVEDGTLLSENDLNLGLSDSEREETLCGVILRKAVFSPDLRILAADFNGEFRVLSAETGKEIRTFGTDSLPTSEMAISADGNLLLSNRPAYHYASNPIGSPRFLDPKTHELRLWEVSKGKEVWRQELPGGSAGPVAISADGKRFAVSILGTPREIRVCDIAKREVLQAMKDDGYPRCLCFSADGRLLVAGMEDGTAVTWDLAELSTTGQP